MNQKVKLKINYFFDIMFNPLINLQINFGHYKIINLGNSDTINRQMSEWTTL